MSSYYTIKGLKVRVSDHEPNYAMDKIRGRNDIELYTHDISGKAICLQDQIERILCTQLADKHSLTIDDFDAVLGKKKRDSKVRKHYDLYDQWFSHPEDNADLIASIKKNPIHYVPFLGLTKKQRQLLINYLNAKIQSL